MRSSPAADRTAEPNDFVAGYSLPYVPVAIIQGVGIFAIGVFFDLEITGSVALVVLVMVLTAVSSSGWG